MKTFIVYSNVSATEANMAAWMQRASRKLIDAKITDVRFKTAYCCTPDIKVICEF